MTKSTSANFTKAQRSPRQRRRGRVAKLPKMSNSERGKYYRHKNKTHELDLEHSVAKLRKQVRDLEQFLRVRDELLHRNPYDSCESIAGTIYDYFVRARDGTIQYDSSFQPEPKHHQQPVWSYSPSGYSAASHDASITSRLDSAAAQFLSKHRNVPDAFLFFDLLSFHVEGCVDAPVVVMRGMLHTKYTRSTIDRMFPHLFHHDDLLEGLLDKEVRYPCTYHFYFGAGGEFHNKIVEADYVHGLQQVVSNLEDVVWLLDGSRRYVERRDSLEDVLRGPTTMALEFILS